MGLLPWPCLNVWRLTLRFRRAWKRERGTSGRCKASPCKRLLGIAHIDCFKRLPNFYETHGFCHPMNPHAIRVPEGDVWRLRFLCFR
jgi:hypothetical protein